MGSMRFASDRSVRRSTVRRLAEPLFRGWFREPHRDGDLAAPPSSTVCLYPAEDYSADFAYLVAAGLKELGLELRGARVLLKPNLVEYESGTVINTNPLVIAGAAEACLRAGASEVVVGEGPGHRRDIEYLLSAAGLDVYMRDLRLRFADLNHDDVECVQLRTRFSTCSEVWLPAELRRADVVVSMPKLKTHHWAGMTASMKNLFGVVPGAVYGWPKNPLHLHGIPNWIVDLTATVRPHLAIVDAVVAMEGDGPIMGSPRPLGTIVMGTDLVAVDATCARMIGLDPAKIPYLAMAASLIGNVDEARIVTRGESPARYATQFEVIDSFRWMQLAT